MDEVMPKPVNIKNKAFPEGHSIDRARLSFEKHSLVFSNNKIK